MRTYLSAQNVSKRRAKQQRIDETNPDFFGASSDFTSNAVNPMLHNQHALRPSEASERGVAGQVGEAHPAAYAHVRDSVHVVGVEHGSLQNGA